MTNHTSMNQQELLTDLLTQEKDLVKDYASGITESSCTNLRELLMSNLAECSADQFAVFDEMHKRQMYDSKQAPGSDVQTARSKMQQLKQQTGFYSVSAYIDSIPQNLPAQLKMRQQKRPSR